IPLREQEVNPAIHLALDLGLDISALHNPFLGETPRVFSLHVEGQGPREMIAQKIGKFFADLTKGRVANSAELRPDLASLRSSLNEQEMESLLWKGKMVGGVFQTTLGRGVVIGGQLLGNAAGINSWADF